MALAPVGDPRRPLQLAIRSSRLLGIIFTLIGVIVCAVFGLTSSRMAGRMIGMRSMFQMLVALVYLVPGVLYLVFAVFIGKRQPWAIVGTMVLSGLHGVMALIACIGAAIGGNIIGLVICVLWLSAMAQLMYHLSKSFESIRADAEYSPRGFEPLAAGTYPVQPPPTQTY